MKFKSYIFRIALIAVGAGALGACEDMLEPDSDYVIYDDGSHLTSAADTATSLIGIIYKLQAIGDRTNLLGEVRGDLVSLTNYANADLRDMANFTVGDSNRYNNPRDYYAVINNCNYFIAYADTAAKNSRGERLFEKDMAQVRAIRAWTYLQLVLNYGKVPFYDRPLLTEQDADDVSTAEADRKDIRGICDYFIADLTPYVNTPWPALGQVGSILMANCFFPVDVVLGDLYLWRASCGGGQADYREAAKCYFRWINDTRNVGGIEKGRYTFRFRDNNNYTENRSYVWTGSAVSSESLRPSVAASVQDVSVYNGDGDNITFIPMDSASSQGYFSELRNLYNSPTDDNGSLITTSNYSITPSMRLQEISRAQSYAFADENDVLREIHTNMMEDEPLLQGDLRLYGQWNTDAIQLGGMSSGYVRQRISKCSFLHVNVYRKTDVWLRLAEALNNGGFPRMAYAILATGISTAVVNDSVLAYCDNSADSTFIGELNTGTGGNNFSYFISRNGHHNPEQPTSVGIHSRGSGYAELNPDYAYPMVDSLDADSNRVEGYTGDRKAWAKLNMETEKAAVDSMIINEYALETCFEGKRFYDLIRFAKRYGRNEWVAGPVSKRGGEENYDGALYSRLMHENNWYLSWKGKIGMK